MKEATQLGSLKIWMSFANCTYKGLTKKEFDYETLEWGPLKVTNETVGPRISTLEMDPLVGQLWISFLVCCFTFDLVFWTAS